MDHRLCGPGGQVVSEPLTIAGFLTSTWIPAIARTIRISTASGYKSHVRNHLVPLLGEIHLAALDGPTLNSFYGTLLAPSPVGRGLSPSTVRRVHATLHRALRDAVRWGLVDVNAADQSDPPRVGADDVRNMKTWTGRQLAHFLRSVERDPLYPLWHLAAMSGLRRGELLGLKRCDVDLFRKLLVIRQTVIDVGGTCHVSKPKTNRGRRVVALDEATVRVLATHLADPMREEADDRWVFSDDEGSHLNPGAVTRRFVRLSLGAGLPRIRLHDLRHTHATLALEAGVHPKIVSERLGHSTVAFTLDVYSHAVAHLQAEAAEEIAAAVQRYRG